MIPQETEEVGHVHEAAALLGLHPHQRWSHTLLVLFSCNNRISDFVNQGCDHSTGNFKSTKVIFLLGIVSN